MKHWINKVIYKRREKKSYFEGITKINVLQGTSGIGRKKEGKKKKKYILQEIIE